MANFSAQQVLKAAASWDDEQSDDHERETAQMLRAYASRLDQDEQWQPVKVTVQEGIHWKMVPEKSDDELREEGRREVLREIQPLVVSFDCGQCHFCGALYGVGGHYKHKPNCLWLRAHALTPETPETR